MKRFGQIMLAVFALIAALAPATATAQAATTENKMGPARDTKRLPEEKLEWYRDAKYGLFIHWGLYAVPAGTWKGERIRGIGEWIMNRAKIPVAEYELLAKEFNPVKFDADAWAKMAHDAGMKYLVITAKHHDGFAMYDSKVSEYDIVDATPFKRDPMKELAAACEKYGLKFCFYYSQAQDWHEKDAVGNTWDWPEGTERNFDKYMEEKGIPQVKEILTQYGPIGLIWFDTPRNITPAQSKGFYDFVHELQPDTLVCSRVGNGYGDYRTMGDNRISTSTRQEAWETPATINDTWGFKSYDDNWKSVETLTHNLVDIASKGGNYLLNVGPTAEGVIPQPSIDRLMAVGEWLKVNGEAIYDTRASDIKQPAWGRLTANQETNRLYLHVFDWPTDGKLVLDGFNGTAKKAYLLADAQQAELSAAAADGKLTVNVPSAAPDPIDTVVVVQLQ